MARKFRRILVAGDFHCGHVTGLTHPEFDYRPEGDTVDNRYKLYRTRRKCYKFWHDIVAELQPIDVLILMGDLVDGTGKKGAKKEILFADRGEQASCAAALINEAKAEKVVAVYGTPYHSGVSEDWEDEVVKEVENFEEIGGVGHWKVNGLIFQARHFVSRSSIPHGRLTPLGRDWLWNVLWAGRKEFPKADVILRAHTHYFGLAGGSDWLGFICPSLQGKTRYGVQKKGDLVDFGVVWFDVASREEWSWEKRLLKLYRPSEALTEL